MREGLCRAKRGVVEGKEKKRKGLLGGWLVAKQHTQRHFSLSLPNLILPIIIITLIVFEDRLLCTNVPALCTDQYLYALIALFIVFIIKSLQRSDLPNFCIFFLGLLIE